MYRRVGVWGYRRNVPSVPDRHSGILLAGLMACLKHCSAPLADRIATFSENADTPIRRHADTFFPVRAARMS
jgi:hypothetical protein